MHNMYHPKFYKKIDGGKIAQDIRNEGFEPVLFSNGPNDVYPKHSHPETKLLVFLDGSMDVTVAGETFHCEAGDKLIISGDTSHSAVVAKNGCRFYWSEKIM